MRILGTTMARRAPLSSYNISVTSSSRTLRQGIQVSEEYEKDWDLNSESLSSLRYSLPTCSLSQKVPESESTEPFRDPIGHIQRPNAPLCTHAHRDPFYPAHILL